MIIFCIYVICTSWCEIFLWWMQEKPNVKHEEDTKMAEMVCSLANREECLACGSWTVKKVRLLCLDSFRAWSLRRWIIQDLNAKSCYFLKFCTVFVFMFMFILASNINCICLPLYDAFMCSKVIYQVDKNIVNTEIWTIEIVINYELMWVIKF